MASSSSSSSPNASTPSPAPLTPGAATSGALLGTPDASSVSGDDRAADKKHNNKNRVRNFIRRMSQGLGGGNNNSSSHGSSSNVLGSGSPHSPAAGARHHSIHHPLHHQQRTPTTVREEDAASVDALGILPSSSSAASNRSSRLMTPVTKPSTAGSFDASSSSAAAASPALPPAEPAGPTIVAYLGDVNVQFPDTLLWKRRTLCIDSQGHIVISSTAGVPLTKFLGAPGIKRFHLSEFRAPHVPDAEIEELPHSVAIDFASGSGMQFASDDRAGQINVLNCELGRSRGGCFFLFVA
jgi:hypothetical protein